MVYMHVYMYICIYRERDRQREITTKLCSITSEQ